LGPQHSTEDISEEDRARIRAEEIFRDEVRASLNVRESSTRMARLWKLLNSSFAIFLLSSVVLSGVSFQYQRWVASQTKKSEHVQLREEASLELNYRFVIMQGVLKEPSAKGRDGLYVHAIFFGQEPYAPAVSRFKSISIPALMFLLKREGLEDPFEKYITDLMPEMTVSIRHIASYKEDQLLDKRVREELLGALVKIKLLAIQW